MTSSYLLNLHYNPQPANLRYIKKQSYTTHVQVFLVTSFGFINKPSSDLSLSRALEKPGKLAYLLCENVFFNTVGPRFNGKKISPKGKI
jgi:hypothetical protein